MSKSSSVKIIFFKEFKGFLKVTRSTLKRRVKGKNQDAVENIKILGSRRPIFSPEQEQQWLQYILEFEVIFYWLFLKYVKKLAFQLAKRNKIKHNFNKDTKMAGKAWATAFRKRRPELKEATSLARAQGFNKISRYFLEQVSTKTNYPYHRIFNVDGSGFTCICKAAGESFIFPFIIFPKREWRWNCKTGTTRKRVCLSFVRLDAIGHFYGLVKTFP